METVLENGPPIGPQTFSSDLICQRMPPVPTFPPMVHSMSRSTPDDYKGGGQKKKKSCNIVTTYVGGRTGNYTKFIYFFHGPNSSKSERFFFLVGG